MTHPASAPRRFHIERVRASDGDGVLRLSGELAFAEAPELWAQLRKQIQPGFGRRRSASLNFDMAGVTQLDSGAAALLAHARAELQRRGMRSEFLNAGLPIHEIIHLHHGDDAVRRRPRRKPRGTLDQIGFSTSKLLREVKQLFAFVGELSLGSVRVIRKPSRGNWKELLPITERAGADAVPIVMLISFLVGLVSAAQAAAQLERYGASIFVADLVGISMARELGPLMTAIVVTGRSGAAFAAEIGSMRVNEEIDALRTMGFSTMRFLVLPRVLALLFVMPLLVLVSDAMGVLGGLVVGVTRLDLTAPAYLHRIKDAVQLWDVSSGLLKSAVFALAIAIISCQQGIATTGGAAEVGRRTTGAVVGILFTLILIDAAFAIGIGALGL